MQGGGGEETPEAGTYRPSVNSLIKYLQQSLTQWQIQKIKEFAGDANVTAFSRYRQVT